MFVVGVLYFNRHPRRWYRGVPKHVAFISELLLQAIKVPVRVLVCCFAISEIDSKTPECVLLTKRLKFKVGNSFYGHRRKE
jgi:hypothetical protein